MESQSPQAKLGVPGHELGIENCVPVKYAPTTHRQCVCLGLVENYIFLQGVPEQ